jgi:hypothetical protein
MLTTKAKKGKWFHTFKDSEIHWQGQILDVRYEKVSGLLQKVVTIQLYSWWTGYPTDIEKIKLSDFPCQCYDTDREMRKFNEIFDKVSERVKGKING